MSIFADLLKKPLPSKSGDTQNENIVTEGAEGIEPTEEIAAIADDTQDGDIDLGNESDGDSDDDDDDLEELEKEISEIPDDELNGDTSDGDSDDDDDDDVTLSDDESEEADKFMAVVATPTVLQSELDVTEQTMFKESGDADIAVDEGFLLESDILDLFEEMGDDDLYATEAAFVPKTKIQFSLADRKKQLFEVGIMASARAHNDRDYFLLQKVYRAKRKLKEKLRKRYRTEALARVKAYIARLKKSKSTILSKIADKITGTKES